MNTYDDILRTQGKDAALEYARRQDTFQTPPRERTKLDSKARDFIESCIRDNERKKAEGNRKQCMDMQKVWDILCNDMAEGEQAKKDLARIKAAIKREQRHACMVFAECEQSWLKAKAEAKTEELKNSATRTATSVLNGVNSLLGGNKVNRLEKENKELRNEMEDLYGQIERLHADMQKAKDNYTREMNRAKEQHQQEVSNLRRLLDKAYQWFPSFKRFLNMERECLNYGFSEMQTAKLLHGQNVNYSGWLHSNEYRQNALADNVSAQVIRDEKRNLFLNINQTPIAQWFREQLGVSQKEPHRKKFRI